MPRLHHLLLPALALLFLAIYNICIADLYAYQGMVPVALDLDFWLIFICSMFVILLVFPSNIRRPSDMFLFFYILISVLWGTVLWQGTGLIEARQQPLFFSVTFLPALVFVVARRLPIRQVKDFITPIVLASPAWLPFILAAILTVSALAAAISVGGGSLEWEQMYVRRLAGRVAFDGHVFSAYAMNMGTNGVLPLLGFVAGYRRSPVLIGIACVFILLMFYLLGLKSPAVNFTVLFGIGFCFRQAWLRNNLVPVTLTAIILVYISALGVFILNENTILADYLVRRISMVQPQVQSYYFDYWLNRETLNPIISSSNIQFSDITFEIGYLYFENPESNANTNAFLYALARGGIAAYVAAIFGVAFILIAIDAMAAKSRSPEFFAVAGLFAILLSEQAWTTVLMTSGIVLVLALVMLFSYPSRTSAITAR
jgi:hypothetical protein